GRPPTRIPARSGALVTVTDRRSSWRWSAAAKSSPIPRPGSPRSAPTEASGRCRPITRPAGEGAPGANVVPAAEPEPGPAAGPAAEPAPEPAAKPGPEPAAKPAPEPAAEPAPVPSRRSSAGGGQQSYPSQRGGEPGRNSVTAGSPMTPVGTPRS